MTDNPLSPAQSPDLRQIVYEKIRDAILDGVIAPGARLSEVDLAEKLAVSRTPVREAIRQLAQDGLVRLVSRKGAYVTSLSVKDAIDLYEIRTSLEMLAVEHFRVEGNEEVLRSLLDFFRSVEESSDPRTFLDRDRRLHALLREASGNRFLGRVLYNVMDLIHLCRRYAIEGVSLRVSAAEHIAILEAILAGDPLRAKTLLRDHLSRARDSLIAYLGAHPQFASREE